MNTIEAYNFLKKNPSHRVRLVSGVRVEMAFDEFRSQLQLVEYFCHQEFEEVPVLVAFAKAVTHMQDGGRCKWHWNGSLYRIRGDFLFIEVTERGSAQSTPITLRMLSGEDWELL